MAVQTITPAAPIQNHTTPPSQTKFQILCQIIKEVAKATFNLIPNPKFSIGPFSLSPLKLASCSVAIWSFANTLELLGIGYVPLPIAICGLFGSTILGAYFVALASAALFSVSVLVIGLCTPLDQST